jgi:site-specific DNA recombinase
VGDHRGARPPAQPALHRRQVWNKQRTNTIKIRGTHGEAGRARRRTTRPYLFRGLLRCGLYGRVMTGNPNHGRNYYRCKASRDFVHQHGIDHPPVLYLREDVITDPADVFLHRELGGSSLAGNLRKLAEAQHRAVVEAEAAVVDEEQLRLTLAECDAKLVQYRAALDAGPRPNAPSDRRTQQHRLWALPAVTRWGA